MEHLHGMYTDYVKRELLLNKKDLVFVYKMYLTNKSSEHHSL